MTGWGDEQYSPRKSPMLVSTGTVILSMERKQTTGTGQTAQESHVWTHYLRNEHFVCQTQSSMTSILGGYIR